MSLPSWTTEHRCNYVAGIAVTIFLGLATSVTGTISVCGDIDVLVAMLDGGVAAVAYLCVWIFIPPLFSDLMRKPRPLRSGAVLLRSGIVLIWTVTGTWSLLRIIVGNFSYGVPSRALQLLIVIVAGLLHDMAVARLERGSVWKHAKFASLFGIAGMVTAGMIVYHWHGFYDLSCAPGRAWW